MANSLGQDLPTGTVVVMRAASPADGTTSQFRVVGGCGLSEKLAATEISGTWLDKDGTPDIVNGMDIDALATDDLMHPASAARRKMKELKEREVHG